MATARRAPYCPCKPFFSKCLRWALSEVKSPHCPRPMPLQCIAASGHCWAIADLTRDLQKGAQLPRPSNRQMRSAGSGPPQDEGAMGLQPNSTSQNDDGGPQGPPDHRPPPGELHCTEKSELPRPDSRYGCPAIGGRGSPEAQPMLEHCQPRPYGRVRAERVLEGDRASGTAPSLQRRQPPQHSSSTASKQKRKHPWLQSHRTRQAIRWSCRDSWPSCRSYE